MANALLNNGPGVVALASAGVGCVVLQETFGTHASRAGLAHSQASALGPLDVPRIPTDTKGLETIFSYDGWKVDANQIEENHASNPTKASAILDTMLFKQQVHGGNGDRRHPFIRKLDALTPKLSYEGWEADAREVEWPVANIYDVIGSRAQYVEIVLERMRSKQAMVSGHLAIVSDLARSHPNLRKMLDERTGVGSRLETLGPEATDVTAPGA